MHVRRAAVRVEQVLAVAVAVLFFLGGVIFVSVSVAVAAFLLTVVFVSVTVALWRRIEFMFSGTSL